MPTVAIIGTLDTKGEEFGYLADLCSERGLDVLMIDAGVFDPEITPDISHDEVASAAGETMERLREDRGTAMVALSKGLEQLLPELYAKKRFDGVLSLGGSGGTALATSGMRALPLGVPKLMVSTMAAGDVSDYVGTSDILMMPSIVDVAGLNAISRTVFARAASAMAGMLSHPLDDEESERPLVAATMFGVTTPCVDKAASLLEEAGYDVLVFHATGAGGKTMERLIADGYITAVADLTTTEWCDELVGGVLSAGPHRLEAAARAGIPQVVSVGALDMVNFGAPRTVPERFASRHFYPHNPQVTLMRTTVEENRSLGRILAQKLNEATAPAVVLLPERGVSALDAEGAPFWDPQADEALFTSLEEGLTNELVTLHRVDAHINDPGFASRAVRELINLMK